MKKQNGQLSEPPQEELNISHVKVLSPVTGSENVSLQERLDANKIVNQYKTEYGFDASAYFENLDGVALYRCNDTGYRFFYPPGLAGDSKLYEHLQNLPWYYGNWRWEHSLANKHITEKDYVLEVGCGFGLFLKRLVGRKVQCAGLEFNMRAVETAVADGLRVYPEAVHDHANNNPCKYSVVCAFQVLEHVSSAGDFIADCLRTLKPYGKLIICVPNSNPFMFRVDKYDTLNVPPHHMGLWNKRSLKNLERFFPVTCYSVRTEPLFEWFREPYFMAHVKYLRSKFPILGSLADQLLRPYSKPLMKVTAKLVEGRNVAAIYTKRPGPKPAAR
jgi:2-polyprenyl-3-methyl-5-hydroxy-6-metoxy-1,4-benzoquinol methylase